MYPVEYYAATKKNEILLFATTWMELEGIMLNEMSDKDKYHMVSLIRGKQNKTKQTQLKQTHRHRDQRGGYQKGGGEETGGKGNLVNNIVVNLRGDR